MSFILRFATDTAQHNAPPRPFPTSKMHIKASVLACMVAVASTSIIRVAAVGPTPSHSVIGTTPDFSKVRRCAGVYVNCGGKDKEVSEKCFKTGITKTDFENCCYQKCTKGKTCFGSGDYANCEKGKNGSPNTCQDSPRLPDFRNCCYDHCPPMAGIAD